MVAAGSLGYQVGEKQYTLHAGDVMVIPATTFHSNYVVEGEMQVLVVRVDRSFERPMVYRVLPGIIAELCGELHRAEQNGNCARVREYLALILSAAACDSGTLRSVRDKELIIEEFFANNYNKEVTLADLAEELKLSNVQTERQIAKYLGTTFRKTIAEKRIEAAKHILATEGISLTEVAERVGYKSYSGFWKAFHSNKQE
jgi:AraC-like DNA-binding protein